MSAVWMNGSQQLCVRSRPGYNKFGPLKRNGARNLISRIGKVPDEVPRHVVLPPTVNNSHQNWGEGISERLKAPQITEEK